jgi:AcrR family transcriptional regulator
MEPLSRKERERQTRENEIIEAAKEVFCSRGYYDASMDEISQKAQFTKRTIYQYFKNKDDLFFAVMVRVYNQLLEYLKKGWSNDHSGFVKLNDCCLEYDRFYRDFPNALKLLNDVGYVAKKAEQSQAFHDFMKTNDLLFCNISELIEEGKQDGSIKQGVPSIKTAYSLVYMITGFFNQLSATGQTFTAHFNINSEDFIVSSLELLLNSIRNTEEK